MNELVLTFNGIVTNLDLYDYRCDKYTHEINVYLGHSNLKAIYRVYESNSECNVSLHFNSQTQTDFMLEYAQVLDILTYDDFVHVKLSIDDITQYSTINRGIQA